MKSPFQGVGKERGAGCRGPPFKLPDLFDPRQGLSDPPSWTRPDATGSLAPSGDEAAAGRAGRAGIARVLRSGRGGFRGVSLGGFSQRQAAPIHRTQLGTALRVGRQEVVDEPAVRIPMVDRGRPGAAAETEGRLPGWRAMPGAAPRGSGRPPPGRQRTDPRLACRAGMSRRHGLLPRQGRSTAARGPQVPLWDLDCFTAYRNPAGRRSVDCEHARAAHMAALVDNYAAWRLHE